MSSCCESLAKVPLVQPSGPFAPVQDDLVRIGTWNLAGRWTPAHAALLASADCDVWLVTEVSDRLALPGHVTHRSAHAMARGRRWAAVLSRKPSQPLGDPHPASAMVVVEGTTYVCSVLPWRACGSDPWGEKPHAARTERTVFQILANLPRGPLVWGGDWNHAMEGREYAGSQAGRRALQTALDELDLQVPTRHFPAAGGGSSIDHVAVHRSLSTHAQQMSAAGLSDHGIYIVET
jgi:endonuclease/exonuclease/phosphatase family metal-dependent hydrolase